MIRQHSNARTEDVFSVKRGAISIHSQKKIFFQASCSPALIKLEQIYASSASCSWKI